MMSRAAYEDYFKEPGTLKNRVVRWAKSNLGRGDTFEKLVRLLTEKQFVNISEANTQIEWDKVNMINL